MGCRIALALRRDPMVFTSFAFLFLFLPPFFLGYLAAGPRWRNLWLLLCSLCFYGWEQPWWVLIMLGTMSLDYAVALGMGPHDGGRRHRKGWLVASIVCNLGVLAWIKYADLDVHSAAVG